VGINKSNLQKTAKNRGKTVEKYVVYHGINPYSLFQILFWTKKKMTYNVKNYVWNTQRTGYG
jgi:hypothetical protein